jgi:hypothetical protein
LNFEARNWSGFCELMICAELDGDALGAAARLSGAGVLAAGGVDGLLGDDAGGVDGLLWVAAGGLAGRSELLGALCAKAAPIMTPLSAVVIISFFNILKSP